MLLLLFLLWKNKIKILQINLDFLEAELQE